MDKVKAFKLEWGEPPLECVGGRWRGPPGAMIPRQDVNSGLHYLIACPGCGELGTAKDSAKWIVVSGSIDDVTTLTLTPSIAKSCCGWHGYLRNGVFEPC